MKKLAILGSGDLARQIAYHAREDGHYQPIGFFDDFQQVGRVKNGLPVLGGMEDVLTLFRKGVFDVLMTGIGYQHFGFRAAIFERFIQHIPFGNVIHSSSYIDKSCTLGSGLFIYPGCVLDMNVVIGDNVLLNAGCVIAHDSSVGKHSFLSPGICIAGFVTIGNSVNLGIGTVIIDNIRVGDNIRTGGGAVVIDIITEPGLYVGVPAKFKKELV